MNVRFRQPGTRRTPASAAVGGKKDAVVIKGPGEEIRPTDRKTTDRNKLCGIIKRGQANVDRSPTCAAVCGKKDAAPIGPGKKIRAADRKGKHTGIRQAGTRCRPACPIVGGKKDTSAISSSKENRVAKGKSHKNMTQLVGTRRCPACAGVGGKKDATRARDKEIRAGDDGSRAVDERARDYRIGTIGLNPLARSKGTKQEEYKDQTTELGSHLVLHSMQPL